MHRYMKRVVFVGACVVAMSTPIWAQEGLPMARGQELAALAMERVDAAGLAGLVGRVIRCERDKPVGLVVQGARGARLEHVRVEGCEVGVVIEPPAEGETGAQPSDAAAFEVSGVTATQTLVSIWNIGHHTLAEYNQVGGGQYGIVITGHDSVYRYNIVHRNTIDGFLITGSFNQVYANDVQYNGGVGIRVASMLPMVDKNLLVKRLRQWGRENVIVWNTILNNHHDLYEFIADGQVPCQDNYWGVLPDGTPAPNTFRTAYPSCIR